MGPSIVFDVVGNVIWLSDISNSPKRVLWVLVKIHTKTTD